MLRILACVPLLALLAACGTYSLLRPADTLQQGQVEFGGGVAVNSIGEGVAHVRAHVGILDWLEVGGLYEVYSALGEVRFGVLASERHGVALALGVGGGYARLWEGDEWPTHGMMHASLTVGRRWRWFELYAGDRFISLFPGGSSWDSINAMKVGVRFTVARHLVFGLEGGATLHRGVAWIGEGTASLALTFGGRPRATAPVAAPPPR